MWGAAGGVRQGKQRRMQKWCKSAMYDFKCNLTVANRQISLALECESAGEEDSETGNRSLQRVLVNLPGTDFQSLERASASQYVCDPESKGGFSAAHLPILYFPAGELAPLILFLLFILVLGARESALSCVCCSQNNYSLVSMTVG